jgi:ABC-type dipeptide/oligopeptide/nickel transport system permease subunit
MSEGSGKSIALATTLERASRPRSESRRVLAVILRSKTAVFGALLLGLYLIMAILAPVLIRHDPNQQDLNRRLAPPIGLGLPDANADYPLGNDNLGRDILSRLIVGSRVSLLVGVSTVILASLVGSIIGALAGYLRGWFDNITMRLVDIWMAFPSLLLAISFGAAFGQGLFNLVLALVLSNWVVYSRIIRAQVLVVREQEFVVAAHAIGASGLRILVRHVLPNTLSSILVIATLQLGTVVITEASMSFLGVSVQSSIPTWGGMLSDGRQFIREAWWLSTFPGIVISILVLAANLLGDGLRDALDPYLQ